MNCDLLRDDILLLAAGALDADEQSRVTRHLSSGCPTCAGAMAESEALVSHLAYALDPIEPPRELRARVMQRVSEESQPGRWNTPPRDVVGTRARPRTTGWRAPLAAAALAATVTGAAVLVPMRQRQQALQTQLAVQARQIGILQASSDRVMQTERLLTSNRLQLVPLTGTATQPAAKARVMWDVDAQRWHLYVASLAPLPAGRTYELWFITNDQRKVPAGTFDVDAGGRGSLTVDLPKDVGTIALAAITDEPAGGSLQPTGSIQAAGAVAPQSDT
ncbi:MAG: anti-sigma factor [Acidobacteriota bacterium]